MSGYTASARLGRPAARLVRRAPAVEGADPSLPLVAADIEPLVEPDDSDGLAGRLAAVRERWTQLTFYLFDPNSWR